ncbi:putative disease resistance protein [Iris pallida]|uniref:Disease resistance protein n=1 Tax=Iris pallida TaxID=29817 RepID=A0AAX6FP72_IRIPA|nr:putative disease resistance protein [Iris pallida]
MDSSSLLFTPPPPPRAPHRLSSTAPAPAADRHPLLLIFAASCFGAALLFLLWAALSFLRARRRNRNKLCVAELSRAAGRPIPPVFSYERLRRATNNFDPSLKLGDGGFGSVYLARLDDGLPAAVKRLHRRLPFSSSARLFCNEVLLLSSLHHPNLLRLHGYCPDPRSLLLVYDYVPNGTLAHHLHSSSPLPFPVRLDIALQIASALQYLHCHLDPPVVHRDVTSANIFLEKDFRVKLGDFGLSRLLSLSDSSEYVCCTGPQGTPGYLDPDYHRSFRLTEKSDIYSFGVVMLELITGMKAVDMGRDKGEVSLAELAVARIQRGALREVLDPALVPRHGEEWMVGTVEAVAELAFRCVAEEKDDRPGATEVVEELRRIRGQVQDAAADGRGPRHDFAV